MTHNVRQINIQDDPDSFGEDDSVLVVVTEYDRDTWEGHGYAYSYNVDGSVTEYNLSHCSCYGPWERQGELSHWATLDQFEADLGSAIGHNGSQNLVKEFLLTVKGYLNENKG